MNGSYTGDVASSYFKGEVVYFRCDFAPDNYTDSIVCGENGWKKEPNCPAQASGNIIC